MSDPLVSAIMPTANRPEMAERAIEYFERQTWPNRELVIVDDGTEPLRLAARPWVRCILLPPLYFTIGLKRNIACEMSNGRYIIHWDDDDRYADDRIEHQMSTLLTHKAAAVTGYRCLTFETPEGRRWRYSGPPHSAVGVSLLYEKAYWAANPFECRRIGEDTSFAMRASFSNRLVVEDGDERIVASIHPRNTSEKREDFMREHPENWRELL